LSQNVNLGIEKLAPDTDIVIFSHNDVIFPADWFSSLDGAWDKVFDLDKVGMINLGFLQFDRKADEALNELFAEGRCEELEWLLSAMKDVAILRDHVWDGQIRDRSKMFGLAFDPWNHDLKKLHMQIGRGLVTASFPMKSWKKMGGFDPASTGGMDFELQHYNLANRKFNLWINNAPLIHLVSFDTKILNKKDSRKFDEDVAVSNELFARKYGLEAVHFIMTAFTETSFIYYDEIIKAANSLDFSGADRIFSDLNERLKNKKLSTCEIAWCYERKKCKYDG
jgi:hypothetical protein